MKIFNLFIAIIIALFFSSCSNNNQQKSLSFPDLYLEGDSGVYTDSTANWVWKTKKIVRYNSSCDSDSVVIKYPIEKDVTTKDFGFKNQGRKFNMDSALAAQNAAIVVPVNPSNGNNSYSGGGNYEGGNGGSNFEIPAWVWELLFGLLAFILFCLLVWALISLISYLRRGPARREEVVNYNTQHHHYNHPQQTGAAGTQQQPVAVTPGQPLVQSTCMAGAPGSVVIPPPVQKMKKETITIVREYAD